MLPTAQDMFQSIPGLITLWWGDQEMRTAISCTECSEGDNLIREAPQKHRLFVQLSFEKQQWQVGKGRRALAAL